MPCDAEVVAYPTAPGAEDAVGRAVTGPDGRFQIMGLPVGVYRVDVSPPGRPLRSIENVFAETGNAGRPLDVVLGLGARLELHVVDEGRRGIAGAEVWIENERGDALHTRAFLTMATGRVRIEGLPEGNARIRVRARGFGMPALQTVRLRDGGTTSAEVVLRPAASLSVRVVAGRDPVPRARVEVFRPNGEPVLLRRAARWIEPDPLGWSTTRAGYLLVEDLEEGEYVLRTTAGSAFEDSRTNVTVTRGGSEARVVLVPRSR
jgi:hypothetical protein